MGGTMKKDKYVSATLILKPTRKAVAEIKKAKTSIRGPLIGTLSLTSWHDRPRTRLEVEGSLKPKTILIKPKKAKAQSARKQSER
jgi:hypothetical protein